LVRQYDPETVEQRLFEFWRGSFNPRDDQSIIRKSAECLFIMILHKFTQTSEGLFGIAPKRTKNGDLGVILHGGNVPVLLREAGGGCYTLVGAVYMHGVMHGEFFLEERPTETFRIL
jgi:hypothetical protein